MKRTIHLSNDMAVYSTEEEAEPSLSITILGMLQRGCLKDEAFYAKTRLL